MRGRTLTSYPGVAIDLRNAVANRVDREVVVDGNLLSSRDPGDVPAFCTEFITLLTGSR